MRWIGLFRNTKIKCLLVKNQPVGANWWGDYKHR